MIRSEGAEVLVPAPKQRVILAALALRAGQVVSYDELAETIWDGAPPAGARVAIRNYVKRLRQIMGPVAGRRIVTRDPGYALEAAPGEVDALRFTALCAAGGEAIRGSDPDGAGQAWDVLTEALGLWRGNPLVDVPSNVLITAEVPRLDALRMQAQEWRMDAGLAQGRHSELVSELTQLARDHPWRERFHAQLMLALYRCGRQAEALAAYQRTRRLLVDELGVEPGRELRDLQAGILAADPRLTTPGSWTRGYLGPDTPATGAPGPGQPGPGGQAASQPAPAAVRPVPARVRGAPVPGGTGPGGSGTPGSGAPGGRARAAAPKGGQAAVVPRQLPAGVAHFAGRTAELAELRAWLDEATSAEESVKVLVIGGTAGAGKTALAVHWAHQSAGEFPDGQLYVNLRGFDPSGTPVQPADALRWFLGAFGVTEEQIPDSIEAQEALYRSVLAGKRVLVILDNARDAAQVRPLLPGSRAAWPW
jgi:DNA-binding SARP family transcriptional activator